MEKLKAPSRIQRVLQPSKSREILDLLAIEQEKAIQREEEYLVALIQESKEFHPQRDVSLLKNMYKEHKRLVETESAFLMKLKELLPELIQNYPKLAPILMTLWVALGVFNDEEWAEGLEEWLTQVLNNVTILKQIWLDTEGIWWVKKHLEWWVEKILDAIQELENTLEKINAMKHPDEVTKQFLENLKKHKKPGSMWIDNLVLSEKALASIQEYKTVYDQQQKNKEQWNQECEEWWKQIVQIVIEQAENEWGNIFQSLQKERNHLSGVDIKTIEDETLEKFNDEVETFEQKIEMKREQKEVLIKKRTDRMDRVTQAETGVVVRWKEKYKDLLERWETWNTTQQTDTDQLQTLKEHLNEGKLIIVQEKQERAFEKLKLKYESIINLLLQEWYNLIDEWLILEKKHIKEDKNELIKNGMNLKYDIQDMERKIAERENNVAMWRKHQNLMKNATTVLLRKYQEKEKSINTRIACRLIEKDLFLRSAELIAKLPEYLAKQEQEWKKPEELVLKIQESSELEESQAEKRVWAIKKFEKEYLEVSSIIDEYFNTGKISEGVHNGRWEVQITGINLKNKTNYAIRRKAVEVPKDGSRWRWRYTSYEKWKKHYCPQSEQPEHAFGDKVKECDLIFKGTIDKESEKVNKILKENVYDQWYELPEWDIETYQNEHITLMRQLLPAHLHHSRHLIRWFTYLCDAPFRHFYLNSWEVQRNDDGTYIWINVSRSRSRLYMNASADNCYWSKGKDKHFSAAFLPCRSR